MMYTGLCVCVRMRTQRIRVSSAYAVQRKTALFRFVTVTKKALKAFIHYALKNIFKKIKKVIDLYLYRMVL